MILRLYVFYLHVLLTGEAISRVSLGHLTLMLTFEAMVFQSPMVKHLIGPYRVLHRVHCGIVFLWVVSARVNVQLWIGFLGSGTVHSGRSSEHSWERLDVF